MAYQVLVAEDEALIAMQIEMDFEDAGYEVLGPCMTLDACFAAIDDQRIDAAVLDVDLAGAAVFPFAKELEKRGAAFVFHTGRGSHETIRDLFPDAAICTKPADFSELLEKLGLPESAD